MGDSGIGLAATSISESSTGTPAAWPSPTRPQDCAKSCQTVLPIPCADGHTPGATALGLFIAFSFAGALCGRLVDLNKFANSAIALCAS